MNAISANGLVHRYRGSEQPAVNGLDFVVPKGAFYGLLGPNGAGKSTTIAMVCGLLPTHSGTLEVLGSSTGSGVSKGIGMVPQDIALYDRLTAQENIGFFGKMQGIPANELRRYGNELLERFGLTEHARKTVGSYSGGMKRRLNLIVALLHRPELLVLDEPTVGVDVHSRNVINSYLKELNKEGTTVLYTSHQLEETQKLCQHLSIMDHGKVVKEGPTEKLLGGVHDLNELFLELTGKSLRDE